MWVLRLVLVVGVVDKSDPAMGMVVPVTPATNIVESVMEMSMGGVPRRLCGFVN
jgi:hypothetical protein